MKERVFYLDVLRAYAILLVVVSHAFSGVCNAMNAYPLPVWGFFNLCNSIIRLCVPLFIMISGKLILGSSREEPYVTFVWRRYSKLLPPFFAWSMIYAYYEARLLRVPFAALQAILRFLAGPTAGHLYFMYIILGLYLVAPVLRAFVRAASRRDQAAVLALWWGFLVVQFFYPDEIGGGPATTLVDYGGYFLLGYFLDQAEGMEKKTGWLAGLCLLLVLFNAWATYIVTTANHGTLDERYYEGYAPLVALYAGAFFLLMKTLPTNAWPSARPHLARWISLLSLESYNIYLIHIFFMWLFARGQLGFFLTEKTGGSVFIGVPLLAGAALAGSMAVSAVLRRVPMIGRWLVTG